MKLLRSVGLLVMAGAMIFTTACSASNKTSQGKNSNVNDIEAATEDAIVYDVTTDKSMYSPGEKVEIQIDLKNRSKEAFNGKLLINFKHLQNNVGETIEKVVILEDKKIQRIETSWEPPTTDFTGYLIEVDLRDSDSNLADAATVGVDVSSTWTKFPRYGYVWDFKKGVNYEQRINKLKDHHINALQYYDWKYRHHKPVSDNLNVWDDWSGRQIYGDSVRGYLSKAHDVNMVNMAYNMAYAAVSGYQQDGVKQDWALYHADSGSHFTFKMADSTPTGITHLFFFDMSNKEWQKYIFNATNKIFDAFEDFDGWHSDTVGEWGEMKTADGKKLFVKDTYTEFLNNAKKAIGEKYLVFNPVGAQGIKNVNKSDVDVLYAEIWPWDKDEFGGLYDSYYSLKKVIDSSREQSGGKSLVVPAYMSYDYGEKNPGKPFNTAAVMLTSSTVYAAGGSRMELGDDGNMLSNEYFPAQNLHMDPILKSKINTLYDFIVAYENLLRDGQEETKNRIKVVDHMNSGLGVPNTIWTFTKKDKNHEIIQMINLLGVKNKDWRANEGVKETPKQIKDFQVKYYYTDEIKSVWVASPDKYDGRSQELEFTKEEDKDGKYIMIQVPSLEYWNMIYMSTEKNKK
ncbi:MAG: glycoside hydrolase family 66 protein [Neobacillus sp.]